MATGARIVCGQRQPIIGDKWTIGPDWEIETFALCADVAGTAVNCYQCRQAVAHHATVVTTQAHWTMGSPAQLSVAARQNMLMSYHDSAKLRKPE